MPERLRYHLGASDPAPPRAPDRPIGVGPLSNRFLVHSDSDLRIGLLSLGWCGGIGSDRIEIVTSRRKRTLEPHPRLVQAPRIDTIRAIGPPVPRETLY